MRELWPSQMGRCWKKIIRSESVLVILWTFHPSIIYIYIYIYIYILNTCILYTHVCLGQNNENWKCKIKETIYTYVFNRQLIQKSYPIYPCIKLSQTSCKFLGIQQRVIKFAEVERETDRQTQRQTQRQTHKKRKRDRQREIKREREMRDTDQQRDRTRKK